ncbi:MAG: SUF system NifU family Fe-S cluster assembly protein [Chitinivibrionales bacterium]|nr:SUF system NifU family Fe-S cluster assembly protein [Chitinivibrionales bacterium]
MEFDDLYQEIILDHYRNPRNAARLDFINNEFVHENPSCGDSFKVHVAVGESGNIEEVTFDGHGCAISTASASMMSELLIGKPQAKVDEIIQTFIGALRGDVKKEALDEMGDIAALKSITQYPVRIKCATLAWHAVQDALTRENRQRKTGDS